MVTRKEISNDLPVKASAGKSIHTMKCLTSDRQDISLLTEGDWTYIEMHSIEGNTIRICLHEFLAELVENEMIGIYFKHRDS